MAECGNPVVREPVARWRREKQERDGEQVQLKYSWKISAKNQTATLGYVV